MHPVLRVGLTGGIGSGKSTVCKLFTELGVPVIDADEIARDLTASGQMGLQLILGTFGTDILTDSGKLDRARLRTIVFNDEVARTSLENILHPLIYKEIDARVKLLHNPYCIVCIPLMIEKNTTKNVDRVLVIDVTEQQQIVRACKRDNTDSDNIISVMLTQTTRAIRLAAADDIIHNDSDLNSLQKQVLNLHEYYNKISHGDSGLSGPGN